VGVWLDGAHAPPIASAAETLACTLPPLQALTSNAVHALTLAPTAPVAHGDAHSPSAKNWTVGLEHPLPVGPPQPQAEHCAGGACISPLPSKRGAPARAPAHAGGGPEGESNSARGPSHASGAAG
jgi:hypothetical protein